MVAEVNPGGTPRSGRAGGELGGCPGFTPLLVHWAPRDPPQIGLVRQNTQWLRSQHHCTLLVAYLPPCVGHLLARLQRLM